MTGSLRPEWSPTASDALVGLFGDGIDAPTIALMLKRPERVVRAELARRGGEALWRPRCMSDEEYASWAEKNAPMTSGKAARPCADCPLGYAADMRAVGRCNGTPGGVEEDEGEMALPTRLPQPDHVDRVLGLRPGAVAASPATQAFTTDVAVAVDLPCPACIHAPVCRIKASIEGRLERLAVATPQLDPALTIQLEAKIECSLFRAERPAKRGGGGSGKEARLDSRGARAATAIRARHDGRPSREAAGLTA